MHYMQGQRNEKSMQVLYFGAVRNPFFFLFHCFSQHAPLQMFNLDDLPEPDTHLHCWLAATGTRTQAAVIPL